MTTVLKLGGSVLTEKHRPETLDDAATARAARAVADAVAAGTELVVVHGGGSFGHPAADRHGLSGGSGTPDAAAAREIHDAMLRLNGQVLDALGDAGVPALPVHPLSAAARDADGELTLCTEAVEGLLDAAFVPVLHGDGVAHAGEGVSVLGGDPIVAILARALEADRVGLCSAVPGVLDADGEVIERVERFDDVADAVGGSAATDVTGGMAGKVRTLLGLPMPAQVFDLDGLPGFLAGERPGTVVAGGSG